MINFKKGDMFADNYDAYINTVNCVGVMGKGIALEFKKLYPKMYDAYRKKCVSGNMKIGEMFSWYDNNSGKIIINFPTKDHWKYNSKYEYIEKGLISLKNIILSRSLMNKKYQFKTLGMPALGCGNGNLDWVKVKEMIILHLEDLDIDITIYEPFNL